MNKLFEILLWLFSFLIFLLGVALIVIPLVIFYDNSFTSVLDFVEQYISEEDLEIFTWVLVGAGVLTIIISTIGCGAAHTKHKCAKILFFIINGIAAAGLAVIAGFLFAKTPGLNTNLQNALGNYTLIYEPNGDSNTVDSNFVETYENKYACCGIFTPGENPDDGESGVSPKCFGWENNIPIGCKCDPVSDGENCVESSDYTDCNTEDTYIWKNGCFNAIENQASTFFYSLGGISVAGAVICGIAALLCIWLCCCDEIL